MRRLCVLVLFASLKAVLTERERPVCRQNTSCVYDDESSIPMKDTFNYKLNGSRSVQVIYRPREKYFLWCTTPHNISVDDHDLPYLPVLTEPEKVEEVEIHDCLVPDNSSYYDAIRKWNVTVSKKLHLKQYAKPILQEHHLRGLQINELVIFATNKNNPPRPSQDFLEGLEGLRTLNLFNVIPDPQAFMRLPVTLDALDLKYAEVPVAISKLGDFSSWLERLRSLKSLSIIESSNVNKPLNLPKFIVSLRNLTKINLNTVLLNASNIAGILNGSSLKKLELYALRTNRLPVKLFEGANLTSLVINYSYHNLSLPRGIFSPLQWLTDLELTGNNLDGATLIDAVSSLPRLQTLIANDNPLGTLCGDDDIISSDSKWPKSLRKLELINTKATRICPAWIENDELLNIDLKDNDIGELTYSDVKMKRAVRKTVTLDLLNNPKLRIINVSNADILHCLNESSSSKDTNNRTRVKVKLNIKSSDVRCDYGKSWLREALRGCSLLVPGESYTDPGEIICSYRGVCLPECSCQYRPRDNATVVNCISALPQTPRWPPSGQTYPLALYANPGTLTNAPINVTLVELHASNNNISSLDGLNITDKLLVLDVRNNNIRHISEDVAGKLSARGTMRSVQLKGNWLDCTCDDETAYKLLEKSQVVSDWNETFCADSIYVSDKMRSGLCVFPFFNLVLGLTCLGLVLLMLGLLLYRFQPQIRQVLFKLNFCNRYVFRVKHDPKKEKDVFLSYYHDDLVQINIIKNALEDRGYSIIEHNRDFNVGDPILSQIENSVHNAHRTIVLLSNHFIKSKWMQEEFRFAHTHALKYQTSKVVVIQNNLSQETAKMLPSDLSFYLKHNTYLDWNDEHFWEKLYKSLGMPRFQVA